MATLKLTVFKAKVLKDGRHKIRIALCHKQETSYIITRFIIDSPSQFKNGQVVKRPDASVMNTKLRNLLNEYQEKLDSISCPEIYTCSQLKNLIISKTKVTNNANTFNSVCDSYIEELLRNGKNSYAAMIKDSKTCFSQLINGNIALSDITPELIEMFSEYIHKKGWSDATIGIHLRNVRTVINRAIKKRMVSYMVHPFISTRIPQSPVREVYLSLGSLRKILNAETESRYMQIVHDLFALSFYLGGINLADMINIDFRNASHIKYSRKKVLGRTAYNNEVKLFIHDKAKVIIDKWMDKRTGKLEFGYNFDYDNFRRHISRGVVKLSAMLDIKERVVFYSARKSFAQCASEIGIPDSVINYCLGHSDKERGIIRFYTKVREKQAEIAINKVIDYVENPEKYKDYIEMRQEMMMSRII